MGTGVVAKGGLQRYSSILSSPCCATALQALQGVLHAAIKVWPNHCAITSTGKLCTRDLEPIAPDDVPLLPAGGQSKHLL
jgi:hypothetical protein